MGGSIENLFMHDPDFGTTAGNKLQSFAPQGGALFMTNKAKMNIIKLNLNLKRSILSFMISKDFHSVLVKLI